MFDSIILEVIGADMIDKKALDIALEKTIH